MEYEEPPETVSEKFTKGGTKISFFDWLENITNNKKDLMITEDDVKSYPAYMVNRGLSMGADTVFYANEMNVNNKLPNDLQYNYLRHAIKKGKRYNTWAKETKIEDLNTVMEFYEVNRRNAIEIIGLLTDVQLNDIKTQMKRASGVVL